MYQKYLLTGATGFLGREVVNVLIGKNAQIRALIMRNDPLAQGTGAGSWNEADPSI